MKRSRWRSEDLGIHTVDGRTNWVACHKRTLWVSLHKRCDISVASQLPTDYRKMGEPQMREFIDGVVKKAVDVALERVITKI